MALPTYDRFIEPILRYLSQHPDGASAQTVYEAASASLGIDEEDKLTLLPSRTQPVYKNRVGWAHDRLKRAGLSSSPRRGYWKLTEKGLAFAQSHQSPLTEDQIKGLAIVDPAVRLRPLTALDGEHDIRQSEQQSAQDAVATPDDRLESALIELKDTTAEDLLETISRGSPKFFETLVLDCYMPWVTVRAALIFNTSDGPATVASTGSSRSIGWVWRRCLSKPRDGRVR